MAISFFNYIAVYIIAHFMYTIYLYTYACHYIHSYVCVCVNITPTDSVALKSPNIPF